MPPQLAVFLSYAREDADAARRIAEALRAAGVEVWFDQNELVGGDAWDAKIRKQIQTCALFTPVISAHTQERREGYFRREWNLAVERTLDMAHGTPFLLPVAIDGTTERDALVPEAFLKVQWPRLPHGEVPPAFLHRVQKLLGAAPEPKLLVAPVPPVSPEPSPLARGPLRWVAAAVGAGRPQSGRLPRPPDVRN